MRYIDFHCDTLKKAFEQGKEEIGSFPEASVDLERLEKGGAGAQFFAAFVPPREKPGWWRKHGDLLGPEEEWEDAYIRRLLEILKTTVSAHSGKLTLVRTAAELEQVWKEGSMAALFTIEDGRSVGGSMERLEEYSRLGVSLITLTWNYVNCFGAPNSQNPQVMEQGLTDFGKEAVEYMNDLGILVDVSHLSDGGFWDVIQVSKKPFVASHSNCRALSPHPRNLTDEMLRALAEHGGVAGLNFCSAFLGKNPLSRKSRLSDLVAHVLHMVQVGGLECAAIGTDFDGIESRVEVPDPSAMELLFDALERAGLSQDAVEQIAWKNAWRVMGEAL